MFSGVKSEIVDDIVSRIPVVFNSAELVKFDRDEKVFKEGDANNGIYFLLEGEVLESKDVRIQVPKKYLANQNQKQIVKEVTIKLHKLVKNAFVGQSESILSVKARQFSCTACLNSTILLKMDAATFLKVISESPLYEREMAMSAKHRFSVSSDIFLKQKNDIVKAYLNQFQQLDHKKKEKNIAGLLNNDANFKQNGLYELFKKEGVFYRDTFERLEGFQEFQARYDPKRSSINRHKIKSSFDEIQPDYQKTIKREPRSPEEKSIAEEADLSFEATKKMLMSPGKTGSPF